MENTTLNAHLFTPSHGNPTSLFFFFFFILDISFSSSFSFLLGSSHGTLGLAGDAGFQSDVWFSASPLTADCVVFGLSVEASLDSVDLLSRFLSSGHTDEKFVADIVISFILARRDTTSSAFTWYLWLLSENPHVKSEVLKEIKENPKRLSMTKSKTWSTLTLLYVKACVCTRLSRRTRRMP